MPNFDFLKEPQQPQYPPQQYGQPVPPPPQYQQPVYQTVIHNHRGKESQALPAIASFFCPGLGQLIQGRAGAGVMFFLGVLISIPLMFIIVGFFTLLGVWLWSIVDAAKWQG